MYYSEYKDTGSVFVNNTGVVYGGTFYFDKFCKVFLENTTI
jgi:hypothetical protein